MRRTRLRGWGCWAGLVLAWGVGGVSAGWAVWPEAVRAEEMSVEVLSAGAEPRVELRYQPDCGQGARAIVEAEQTVDSELAFGTAVHRLEVLPAHKCDDAGGKVAGRYQVLSASGKLRRRDGEEEPEDPALTELRQQLSHILGSNFRRLAPSLAEFDADPLGRVGQVRMRVPNGSMGIFRRILESYWRLTIPCAVLPAEPIGIGAIWRVRVDAAWVEEAAGLAVELRDRTTLEYELLAVDGDRFEVGFSGRNRGSESMDVAGMGTMGQDLRGEIEGRSVCSTRRMFPLQAEIAKTVGGTLGLSTTIRKGNTSEPVDVKAQRSGVLTLRVNP